MSSSFQYSHIIYPPAPIAKFIVRGPQAEETLNGLLDSGSDATMIPLSILVQIGARFQSTDRIRTVGGGIQDVELYLVAIQIAGHNLYGIEAVATEYEDEIIIGRDVLNHLITILDGINSMTEIS